MKPVEQLPNWLQILVDANKKEMNWVWAFGACVALTCCINSICGILRNQQIKAQARDISSLRHSIFNLQQDVSTLKQWSAYRAHANGDFSRIHIIDMPSETK